MNKSDVAEALEIAANRLDRLALNAVPNSREWFEIKEWASEARRAREAAAAIASQSERIAELEKALEPFAKVAAEVDKFGTENNDGYKVGFSITFGDVRRARACTERKPR